MKTLITGFAGGLVAALALSTGALAQTGYDDATCRQYADQNTAALRAQAGNQAATGALGGALLGAGIGAAVGGGRGAAIGAGAGALAGTGAGAANAQSTSDYANQQYYAYYQQCMASRSPAQPRSGYAQPGYAQPSYQSQPGYQQPGYAQPGYQQPGYQQPGYAQPGYQQPGYQSGYGQQPYYNR